MLRQLAQFGDCAPAGVRGQPLLAHVPLLRRIKAVPDFSDFRPLAPKARKLREVPWPLDLLPSDRAVDHQPMPRDVLENSFVGCGRAAEVVLGLKAVNRDHQVQVPKLAPSERNRPHRARHKLYFDPHLGESWQQDFKLSVAHQRLAAHNRYVQRPVAADQGQDAFDEGVTFVVSKLAQRARVTQVAGFVGIAAWTPQRAFAGDLDRKQRPLPLKDSSPR